MATEAKFTYRSEKATVFLERWYQQVLEKWPVPYREHSVETSFGTTYVIECGSPDAEPLVLLHGVGMNSGSWRLACDIETLSKENRLLLVDIIGDAGRSMINERPKSGEFYADWLHEVLSGLDIEKAILAGASFGGAISLYTAYKHPSIVSRVIAMVPIAVICKVRFFAVMRMILLGLFFSPKKMISFLEYVNGGELETERVRSADARLK